MTTNVLVRTHSWPAEVRAWPLMNRNPLPDAEWSLIGTVPPESEISFVVHDGQDLMVRELPRNNTAPPPERDEI
jgi:hypothetical protein